MNIKNDYLKEVYNESILNLNDSFSDLDNKLSDEESFIRYFDKRNLNEIKYYCAKISINPSILLKNFFYEKIDSINNYFRNLLLIEDINSKFDIETCEIKTLVRFQGKELILIDLINKTFKPLIPMDKSILVKRLKEDIRDKENKLNYYNNLLLNEKLIKQTYNIKKIKALNNSLIKTLDDAIEDINKNKNHLTFTINKLNEEIDNISNSRDEKLLKIEDIIPRLNKIDFDIEK